MKTVKVRIAVAVDAAGDWSACGWQVHTPGAREKQEADMLSMAAEPLASGEARYWIEAEVPVPEVQTVPGTVTEGEPA